MESDTRKVSDIETESGEDLRESAFLEDEHEGEISPIDDWIDSVTDAADKFFSESLP